MLIFVCLSQTADDLALVAHRLQAAGKACFPDVSHPESSRRAKTAAAATDYIQTSPPRVFIYYSFIPPFSFLTKHSSLLSSPCRRLGLTTLRLRGYCPLTRFLLFRAALSLPSLISSAVSLGFSLHVPHFLNSSLGSIPLIFPFPIPLPICTRVMEEISV